MRLSFLAFQEGTKDNFEKVSFIPFLNVVENTLEKKSILSLKLEAQELVGRGKKQVNISFVIPQKPNAYLVETGISDAKGNPLSGTLKKAFLVEGNFGEIKFFSSNPETFLSRGQDATFAFQGTVHNPEVPVSLKVSIQQFFGSEKESEKTLTIPVNFRFNDFQASVSHMATGRGATKFVLT